MYNRRTWLNSEISDSTGSVVAFDGRLVDYDGKQYNSTFLEIADCRNKIRLHITSDDTKEDFKNKLKLLKTEIELFLSYIETSCSDNPENSDKEQTGLEHLKEFDNHPQL